MMRLVHTDDRYNYFVGNLQGPTIYNVKAKEIKVCNSGYYDVSYLEEAKRIKFPNRFKRIKA